MDQGTMANLSRHEPTQQLAYSQWPLVSELPLLVDTGDSLPM